MKNALIITLAVLALSIGCASMAAADDHDKCVKCHSSEDESITPDLREMYLQWKSSSHYRANVDCYDCHGGNLQGATKEEIHEGMIEIKDPSSAVDTCGKCHEGQKQAFLQSMHYKSILNKKTGPSCVTCHGSRKASKIDPLDVPAKCAQCHNSTTGNHPDIPAKAAEIFELYEQTKAGIAQTAYAILKANQEGKEVAKERRSLDAIRMIVDNLSVSWHAFDLDAVKETLRPLPVSLHMAGFQPSVSDLVLRWIKIIALAIVILVCLVWIVDKTRSVPKK